MNMIKPLTLTGLALCSALALSTSAQAQEDESSLLEKNAMKILDDLRDLNEKCKNGTISFEKFQKKISYFDSNLDFIRKDITQKQAERFGRDFPTYTDCPPKTDIETSSTDTKTEAEEKKQTSNPPSMNRLIGYGRFGLDGLDGLGFNVGLAQVDAPQAGYGVVIVPGAEKFVAKTDSSLTGYSVGGRVRLRNGGRESQISTQYINANGSSEFKIDVGNSNVGIVYHDDTVGSTGVAIGPRGLDVRTETSYEAFDFTIGIRFFPERLPLYIGPHVKFTDTKHKAMVTTPTFSDIRSDSEQNIDEAFFSILARTQIPIISNTNESGPITFTLFPMLELGLRHAELASRQHNICGLCGASERDFNVDIQDDNTGFFYGGGLEANLGYDVSQRIELGVLGKINWTSDIAAIRNPETGDDLFIRNSPTHLGTDDGYSTSLRAFINAEF